MDSKPSKTYLAAPCLAISAALFFLGTGLSPVWALTWLAPIPVLWISPRVSARQAFFVALAAYALGGLNEWAYSRTVLPTFIVATFLLASCVSLCYWRFALPVWCVARQTLAGGCRFSGLLGHRGICSRATVGPRHIRQYQLFTDGFSADLANCVGSRNLGNQLLLVSVRRHPSGPSAIWSEFGKNSLGYRNGCIPHRCHRIRSYGGSPQLR